MRLILRVIGTWLLGLALILLIIDGTKTLGAGALAWATFGDTWAAINADSFAAMEDMLAGTSYGPALRPLVDSLLALPDFLVPAVPGLLLILMGRTRRTGSFIRHDQI